jgi:hypothetical protein
MGKPKRAPLKIKNIGRLSLFENARNPVNFQMVRMILLGLSAGIFWVCGSWLLELDEGITSMETLNGKFKSLKKQI